MLQVTVSCCDSHELKEWDQTMGCGWAVLHTKVNTEEEPSPHPRDHILGSALGKSVRLGDEVFSPELFQEH